MVISTFLLQEEVLLDGGKIHSNTDTISAGEDWNLIDC